MDIILGRLTNGAFVIGKHNQKSTTNDDVKMVVLISNADNPNEIQAKIVPFMHPISNEKVNLKIHALLTYVQAPDNLTEKYQQLTGGIILAQPKIFHPVRPN